jgi:3D (Asp-Asp-Asp) domain-containing protein
MGYNEQLKKQINEQQQAMDKEKENSTEVQKQLEENIDELKKQIDEQANTIKDLQDENARLKIIHAKITAYSPLDDRNGINADATPTVTSRGLYPKRGIAAADPRKLAYGTRLYVPGYGMVEIQDTGGAMRSYDGVQIDIVMDSYEEAKQWGVKYLDVIIQ